MSESNLFSGPNAAYVYELYDRYRESPDAVDADTRAFFDAYPTAMTPAARNGHGQEGEKNHASALLSSPAEVAELMRKTTAAARLSRLIRQRGHLMANVDPLGLSRPEDPRLGLSAHGLTEADLAGLPSDVVVGSPLREQTANALDAINRLRQIYTGSIGYDDEHIQTNEERYWLREAADSGRYFEGSMTPLNANCCSA